MKVSVKAFITCAILLIVFSCGGEPEPAQNSEDIVEEVAAETLQTEEPIAAEIPEQIPETAEIVPVSSGLDGSWDTTMGEMVILVDEAGNVSGEYPLGTIEGTLTGNTIEFVYTEGSLSGTGSFTLSEDHNSFSGLQDISGTELVWEGRRL